MFVVRLDLNGGTLGLWKVWDEWFSCWKERRSRICFDTSNQLTSWLQIRYRNLRENGDHCACENPTSPPYLCAMNAGVLCRYEVFKIRLTNSSFWIDSNHHIPSLSVNASQARSRGEGCNLQSRSYPVLMSKVVSSKYQDFPTTSTSLHRIIKLPQDCWHVFASY